MFGKKIFKVWASLLPILMLVASCAQTADPTPISSSGGYEGEGADDEIANFITENSCASRGGDADEDNICDDEDDCIGNADCNDNGVKDDKDPDWWDGVSDFEKFLMISTAAAGSWVGLNCAFGNSCWDFDAWFIHSDRHDEWLEFNVHELERAKSSMKFFIKDNTDYMTLRSTLKTSDTIGLTVNGNVKSLGRYLTMCIHSKFALSFDGEAENEVKLQMQFTPKTSLETFDNAISKSEFDTEFCEKTPGIWVAVEKDNGLFYVSSMDPRNAGFAIAPDVNDSKVNGTAYATTRLAFQTLSALGTASFRMEELEDPTVATKTYSNDSVAASSDQSTAFAGFDWQNKVRAALGKQVGGVAFSSETSPREYVLTSVASSAQAKPLKTRKPDFRDL